MLSVREWIAWTPLFKPPHCYSCWQCSFDNVTAVPAYIPSNLMLTDAVAAHNVSTREILAYQIGFEPFMFELMGMVLSATCSKQQEGTAIFIDSGANEGLWSMLAGTLGCHVLAVEPQPGCHKWIQESLELNPLAADRVHLWKRFLTPDTDAKPLSVASNSCLGSEKFESSGGRGGTSPGTPQRRRSATGSSLTARMSVAAARLDASAFLTTHHPEARVALWHLDTEGAEIAVLRSASQLFKAERIDRVVLELTPSSWAGYGVSLAAGYAELARTFGNWSCTWACNGGAIDWHRTAAQVGRSRKGRQHHQSPGGHCASPWNRWSPAVDAYCVHPAVPRLFPSSRPSEPRRPSRRATSRWASC